MSFDASTFRLNSPKGKRILATLREGDYAHPGEEEAIVKTLQPFSGKPRQHWLDAGCGRGGTADYVSRNRWAHVTAFDIDRVSIREARQKFPDVRFFETGVENAPDAILRTFDLIYAFNAFYAFPNQPAALRALRSLAKESTPLVLFDYLHRGGVYESPLFDFPEAAHWHPIETESLREMLCAAGWEWVRIQDLDADYERWYAWLLTRFETRSEALLSFATAEEIAHVRRFYSTILESIQSGILGGAIIQARAIGRPAVRKEPSAGT